MVKTQDEPTVGHLESAKNVQTYPSTGRTRTLYRKHSTTLQFTLAPTGPAEGGGLAASLIITEWLLPPKYRWIRVKVRVNHTVRWLE